MQFMQNINSKNTDLASLGHFCQMRITLSFRFKLIQQKLQLIRHNNGLPQILGMKIHFNLIPFFFTNQI